MNLRHPFCGVLFALIGGFTLASGLSTTCYQFYVHHVRPWMLQIEFAISWGEFLSHLFAMFAFRSVRDWTAAYFDCFTPISMWCEVAFSITLQAEMLFFTGDVTENPSRIFAEFGGMTIVMASIYLYAVLKNANDENYHERTTSLQGLVSLIILCIWSFVVLIQLQMKTTGAKGYLVLSWILACAGILALCLQLGASIWFRVSANNWEDDDLATANTKSVSAIVSMFLQMYNFWIYTTKGYWESGSMIPIAVMTAVFLAYTILITIKRSMGPSRIRRWFIAARGFLRIMISDKCGFLWGTVEPAVSFLTFIRNQVRGDLPAMVAQSRLEQEREREREQRELAMIQMV